MPSHRPYAPTDLGRENNFKKEVKGKNGPRVFTALSIKTRVYNPWDNNTHVSQI